MRKLRPKITQLGSDRAWAQTQGGCSRNHAPHRNVLQKRKRSWSETRGFWHLLKGCVWAANPGNILEEDGMGLPCTAEKPLSQTGAVSREVRRASSHLFCRCVRSTGAPPQRELPSLHPWGLQLPGTASEVVRGAAWPDAAVATAEKTNRCNP